MRGIWYIRFWRAVPRDARGRHTSLWFLWGLSFPVLFIRHCPISRHFSDIEFRCNSCYLCSKIQNIEHGFRRMARICTDNKVNQWRSVRSVSSVFQHRKWTQMSLIFGCDVDSVTSKSVSIRVWNNAFRLYQDYYLLLESETLKDLKQYTLPCLSLFV